MADVAEKTAAKNFKNAGDTTAKDPVKSEMAKKKEPLNLDQIPPKYARLMAVVKDDFNPLPDHMRADNVPPVSSVFKERTNSDGSIVTTRDIIRGLNDFQEQILLPKILGMSRGNDEFEKAVRDFWVEFKVSSPLEPVGKRLNYATYKSIVKLDGNEVEYDHPVNLTDYMEYNFAKQHPRVASTPEQQENKDMYSHVLIDEAEEKERKSVDYVKRKQADKAFVLLVDDSDERNSDLMSKMDYVIQLLKSPEEFVNMQQMSAEDKGEWLRERKEADPLKFVNVVNDSDLETKAFRSALVERGHLKYENEFYYYGKDNIGKETGSIDWLKSSKNSDQIKDLKTKLEESFMKERTMVLE